jgi:hypothetical protein
MRNTLVAILLVLCAIAFTAPAFAAPVDMFADVPANHWSYDAVKKLANDGIIEGTDGRLFKGDRTITRYEMAIIVANAITKVDKADAKQKALIEKLSREFQTELDKIGARVDKLEAAQPKLKFGGQARFTYAYRNDTLNNPSASYWGYDPSRNNYFTYRLRLEVTGQPDPNLLFFARVTGQDYDIQTGAQNISNPVTPQSFNDPKIEDFWVKWNLGPEWSITAGRQGLLLGKAGFAFTTGSQDIFSVDYATPKLSAKLGYWNIPGTTAANTGGNPNIYSDNNALLSQLRYTLDKNHHIDVYNIHELSNGLTPSDNVNFGLTSNYKLNMTSFGYDGKVSDKISFYGEYAKNTAYSDHNTGYWFGFTNGDPTYHPGFGLAVLPKDWTKVGTSAQSLIYRSYGSNVVSVFDAQFNAVLGNNTVAGALWLTNTKGIEFYSENVVAKNVFLLTQIGQANNIDNNRRESTYGQCAVYFVF